MIVDPYVKGAPFGRMFAEYVRDAKNKLTKKDDDFILVIVGTTGTGKSNLGLWTYEEVISPEFQTIAQVALTPSDMGKAIKNASETKRGERYAQYDEGKLNRREWQSEWSKELLSLYHDIRGENIFHTWCTAYPELLDQVFVKERVGALAFIYTKDDDRPRLFLLFTKNDLLRFIDQNKKISTDLLKKYGKSHASMQSWFTEYKGALKATYLEKKEERMKESINKFYDRWSAQESYTTKDVMQELGVKDKKTIAVWIPEAGLELEKDYSILPNGSAKFFVSGKEKLKSYLTERTMKRMINRSLAYRQKHPRAILRNVSLPTSSIVKYSNARGKKTPL